MRTLRLLLILAASLPLLGCPPSQPSTYTVLAPQPAPHRHIVAATDAEP